ncbi:MAG: DsbA family oxidoreductase [Candidatus Sericytochromatia bacterium]
MFNIEVWSDVVCPFCYIGKRHLEAALADFPHREQVAVVWRSFELDSETPKGETQDTVSALMQKYQQSREQIQTMMARVMAMGGQVGLDLKLDKTHRTNTFDLHRLLYLAAQHGLQGAAKERLLYAYFTELEQLGEVETLVRLLSEVGLDPEAVRATLADPDIYFHEVSADLFEARNIGVSGVPFFVFDQKYAVSGAQPISVFKQVLQRSWDERGQERQPPPEQAAEAASEGVQTESDPRCQDESCEI